MMSDAVREVVLHAITPLPNHMLSSTLELVCVSRLSICSVAVLVVQPPAEMADAQPTAREIAAAEAARARLQVASCCCCVLNCSGSRRSSQGAELQVLRRQVDRYTVT